MNATHTPGPWKWNEYFCGLNGAGEEVLSWAPYEGMWLPTYIDSHAANAALIAAAPDLLAALRDIVAAAEGATNGRNVTNATRRAECAVIARTAIARAEGDQP